MPKLTLTFPSSVAGPGETPTIELGDQQFTGDWNAGATLATFDVTLAVTIEKMVAQVYWAGTVGGALPNAKFWLEDFECLKLQKDGAGVEIALGTEPEYHTCRPELAPPVCPDSVIEGANILIPLFDCSDTNLDIEVQHFLAQKWAAREVDETTTSPGAAGPTTCEAHELPFDMCTIACAPGKLRWALRLSHEQYDRLNADKRDLKAIIFKVSVRADRSASGTGCYGRIMPGRASAVEFCEILDRVKHVVLKVEDQNNSEILRYWVPSSKDGSTNEISIFHSGKRDWETLKDECAQWSVGVAAKLQPLEMRRGSTLEVSREQVEGGDATGAKITTDILQLVTPGTREIRVKLCLQEANRTCLILDLGAASHLCGRLEKSGGVTWLDSSISPGEGRDKNEADARAYAVPSEGAPGGYPNGDMTVGDPFRSRGAAAKMQQGLNSKVSIVTGRESRGRDVQPPDFVPMPDLKWMLHAGISRQRQQDFVNRFGCGVIEVYQTVVIRRVEDILHRHNALGRADTTSGEQVVALVFTHPGHVRAHLHHQLVEMGRQVSDHLHRHLACTMGYTSDPRRHVGSVRFIPEPFALATSRIKENLVAGNRLVAIDVGKRTFDAAVVDAQGTEWKPSRCLGANLGGQVLDYVLLARVRQLIFQCAPGQDGDFLREMLKIDDEKLLDLFFDDTSAYRRSRQIMDVVETAKLKWNGTGSDFELPLSGRVFGQSFVDRCKRALPSRNDGGIWIEESRGRVVLKVDCGAMLHAKGAVQQYLGAASVVLDACLKEQQDNSKTTLFIGGRGVLFAPLKECLETAAGKFGLGKLEFELNSTDAKKRLVEGAAHLVNNRNILTGSIPTEVFVLLFDDEKLVDHHRCDDILTTITAPSNCIAIVEKGHKEIFQFLQDNSENAHWLTKAFFVKPPVKASEGVRLKSADTLKVTKREETYRDVFKLEVSGMQKEIPIYRFGGLNQ